MILLVPQPARADFWGGDVMVLVQILAQSIQQLAQLREIFGTGQDTLNLIKDINQGISDALNGFQSINRMLKPGVLGDIRDPGQLYHAIQDIYGTIPQTQSAKMEQLNDQSVSEAITLHNEAFQYAGDLDPEAERLKESAANASPQGAAKLTAQSLGVLIHVTNQVLRTNAAILKIVSQNLAMSNHKEKVNSEHFKTQYEGLGNGFSNFNPQNDFKISR